MKGELEPLRHRVSGAQKRGHHQQELEQKKETERDDRRCSLIARGEGLKDKRRDSCGVCARARRD